MREGGLVGRLEERRRKERKKRKERGRETEGGSWGEREEGEWKNNS